MSEQPSIYNAGYSGEPQHHPQEQPASEGANNRQVAGSHYLDMPVQPWDVIDSWPTEQRVGFYRGNAIKYLMRMGSKDARNQEVRKAQHYVDKLVETLEADRPVPDVAVHDRGPR